MVLICCLLISFIRSIARLERNGHRFSESGSSLFSELEEQVAKRVEAELRLSAAVCLFACSIAYR